MTDSASRSSSICTGTGAEKDEYECNSAKTMKITDSVDAVTLTSNLIASHMRTALFFHDVDGFAVGAGSHSAVLQLLVMVERSHRSPPGSCWVGAAIGEYCGSDNVRIS